MRIADVLRNKGASVATITPETSVSGLLNDRDLKTRFCQPVRGGRPGNACPGDEHVAHDCSLVAVSVNLQQVQKCLSSR